MTFYEIKCQIGEFTKPKMIDFLLKARENARSVLSLLDHKLCIKLVVLFQFPDVFKVYFELCINASD